MPDKRFKPQTPAEQMQSRIAFYEAIESRPGLSLQETLQLVREHLHLTSKELAKVSRLSDRAITDMLAGRGNPSLKSIEAVLGPFELSIGVFRQQEIEDEEDGHCDRS